MSVILRQPVDDHGLGLTGQRVRDRLIQRLTAEGIRDERVLQAIRHTPRHLFVDEAISSRAYEDTALPIGNGQTISQPWIVARMTEVVLEHTAIAKVLEIGTGSGYQAAVLAGLVPQVYTIERLDPLLRKARRRFRQLGLDNIRSRHDDGRSGWADEAPFDAIIVTAAAGRIEPSWLAQLAPGGLMVAPVGDPSGPQRLRRLRKDAEGQVVEDDLGAVAFVPILPGLG